MTAAHFIFIPAVLIIGIVIGWILASRAAQDAFSAELKRREERQGRKGQGQIPSSKSQVPTHSQPPNPKPSPK